MCWIKLKIFTLAPIWFPHWPAWRWTISLIFFDFLSFSKQRL